MSEDRRPPASHRLVQRPFDGFRKAFAVTAVLFAGGFGYLALNSDSTVDFVLCLVLGYATGWATFGALSPLGRRKTIYSMVAANASLLLVVAAAESFALAGTLDYREVFRTPILAPWENPRYRYDPDVLYTSKPGFSLDGRARGGSFTFLYDVPDPTVYRFDLTYDEQGFRSPIGRQRADIVLIGDSYLEAGMLVRDSILFARLERITGRTVANLGLVGYGPRRELAALEKFGLPYRPRTVIWLFYEGNDLKNLDTWRELTGDESTDFLQRSVERSFTKNALQALARLAGDPKPDGTPRSAELLPSTGMDSTLFFTHGPDPLEGRSRDLLDEALGILESAAELCQRHGIEFKIAFIPTKYRVYHGLVDQETAGEVIRGWGEPGPLPERLREGLQFLRPEAEWINLTPALRRAVMDGESVYFRDDSHWNASGHRVAADVLSRVIADTTEPPRRP